MNGAPHRMPPRPVAAYLAEIGRAPDACGCNSASARSLGNGAELAAVTAAAYTKGFVEGERAAEQQSFRALEEQAVIYASEVEALRQQWCAAESDRLEQRLVECIHAVTHTIAASAAPLIERLVVGDAQRVAMTTLIETLSSSLSDGRALTTIFEGPRDLLDALRQQLQNQNQDLSMVNFKEAGSADVRMTVDALVVESRLQEWVATLRCR